MKNKHKIVVIGGSGFLGSHLSEELSDAGYEVTIFDFHVSPWLRENQNMIVGDILDSAQVLEALKETNYVYHLAGIANISQAASHPKETIETNIIGATNVIEACIKTKVKRLLFASTVYVYSRQGSFYRVSKEAVESLLEAYHDRFGLDYTILRYGSLYGPRAQDWNGLKRYVVQAVKEGRIVYPGTGEERREYIHVRDAAKLSIQALTAESANQCLTITGTQILTTKDAMYMIREIIGREIEIDFSPLDDPDYEIYHYSLTPYRYTPRRGTKVVPNEFVDLGEGILELVEEIDNSFNDHK